MTEGVKSYKDLKVWQKAVDLIPKLYEELKAFPKGEEWGLTGQIRRAAISIPSNIAEGQARHHRKEFLQSLYVARGSLAELETLLIVSQRVGYLSSQLFEILESSRSEIARMLEGLIRAL